MNSQLAYPSACVADVWLKRHSFSIFIPKCTLKLDQGRLSLTHKDKVIFDSPVKEVEAKLSRTYYTHINFIVESQKYRVFFQYPNKVNVIMDISGKEPRDWWGILATSGAAVN